MRMQRKRSNRVLALLLAVVVLMQLGLGVAFANTGEDSAPRRISVSFYGDSGTARGFSWHTGAKTRSDVAIGTSVNLRDAQIIRSSATRRFQGNYVHQVAVESLTPGTTYYYRVGDETLNVWSATGTFKTAPAGDAAFTFLAIADVQASNLATFQKAAAVTEQGLKTHRDTAFLVNLGDFVNDCTNEEWDDYFTAFGGVHAGTTIAPVAGNHDGNFKWGWFQNQFKLDDQSSPAGSLTGAYYSFDYANVHFTVLNTNDMYPMSQQQLNWLQNDISGSDAEWKIVLLHRSLYSAGKNINKPDTLIMRNHILPVLDSLDVDLVLGGHDHMYMRTNPVKNNKAAAYTVAQDGALLNPQGIIHVLPNTAGSKRYKVNENAPNEIMQFAAVADQPGLPVFSAIKVDGDTLTYSAYTVDTENGNKTQAYDTFSIRKTTPKVSPAPTQLPTGFCDTLPDNMLTFAVQLCWMVVDYLLFVPELIAKSIQ